jgi:hypothetical protein
MVRGFFANFLRALRLQPHFRLALILVAIVILAAAVYLDLLPYPVIATGYVANGPAPFGAQGIVGHISYGPLAPTCYANGTIPGPTRLTLPDGRVYRQGLSLNIPIVWHLGNCGAEGNFTAILSSPGVYQFTLSNCATLASLGCTNLPATVTVLPFQIAQLDVYADTGVR